MRWLFVTVEFPWPLLRGNCLRIYNLTRSLVNRGEEVELLSFMGTKEGTDAYQDIGVKFLELIEGKPLSKGPSAVRFGPFVYQKRLADILKRSAQDFDVVFLVNSELLQYAKASRGARYVIANIADDPVLESLRRLSKVSGGSFWYYVQFILRHFIHEYAFVRYVDLITFVTERDAFSFSIRHPFANIHFVHNGVDPDYFYNPTAEPLEGPYRESGDMDIVFTGNMSHMPNIDAAEYIAEEIAPRVWSYIPQVRFKIVGANPPRSLKRYSSNRFVITGFVEDIRPFLWQAMAVLVPMRIGTGIKNKILHAWSAQRPVIATSLACQGLPAQPGRNILVDDTPKGLSEWIVKVIEDSDLRKRIAQAGRETIISKMKWDDVLDRYFMLINELSRQKACAHGV